MHSLRCCHAAIPILLSSGIRAGTATIFSMYSTIMELLFACPTIATLPPRGRSQLCTYMCGAMGQVAGIMAAIRLKISNVGRMRSQSGHLSGATSLSILTMIRRRRRQRMHDVSSRSSNQTIDRECFLIPEHDVGGDSKADVALRSLRAKETHRCRTRDRRTPWHTNTVPRACLIAWKEIIHGWDFGHRRRTGAGKCGG